MDRRAFLAALGVLGAGCAGGGGEGSGGTDTPEPTATTTATATTTRTRTATATPTATPEPIDTDHGMNEAFVVGNGDRQVQYAVTNFALRDAVGSENFGEEASGVFGIVDLNVQNVGKESFNLSSNVFTLVDGQEREYDVDDQAMVYIEDSIVFEQVNPGLEVQGVLVFDVPQDQQERRLRIGPVGFFSSAPAHYVTLES